MKTIEYHREPTPAEVKFGEGATHYREFSEAEVTNKKWIKADDGLRYWRF